MKKISALMLTLLAVVISASANDGAGEVRVGYTILDEEGSQAVNHSTFNQYEGLGLSMEKIWYRFDNGIRLNADLKNITLNNRHLGGGISKAGLFGLQLNNHQYRRAYGFDGSSRTRRHFTDGSLWVYPFATVKLFGGGSYTGLRGAISSLFNPDGFGSRTEQDYRQSAHHIGLRFNDRGKMFQAEYRGLKFDDRRDDSRDQDRYWVKLFGFTPLPQYEKVILSGGYRHFETKYSTSEFKISANTVWGGGEYRLADPVTVNYNFIFDRAGSDSDFVATDNLAHTFYVSYIRQEKFGGTVGYQTDVRDDFEDKVTGDSYYLSGWYKPDNHYEFRVEYGTRAETMDNGSRLLGNEDRTRFKASAVYRDSRYGSIAARFESRTRENLSLGSESDFNRISLNGSFVVSSLGTISGGYAYAKGDYQNSDYRFEFTDHTLHGDLSLNEFYRITSGAGVIYYRSKRDLDVEQVTVRLSFDYHFVESYHFKVDYNIHNFDDYLTADGYYTANIVELNLVKDVSF